MELNNKHNNFNKNYNIKMFGDWGLGPIPNPQSPICRLNINCYILFNFIINYIKIIT